jgi:hypothetical protein
LQSLRQRQSAMTADLPTVSANNKDQWRRLCRATVCLACFVLHFGEMWVVMAIGMAAFGPVRLALASQGYTGLLDPMSIDSEVGMGIFMVVPMVLWIRIRGRGWRDCGEMAVAMVIPWAGVLLLNHLGLTRELPWLSMSGRTAMLLGMLVIMLHYRNRYMNGHALIRWPGVVQLRSR